MNTEQKLAIGAGLIIVGIALLALYIISTFIFQSAIGLTIILYIFLGASSFAVFIFVGIFYSVAKTKLKREVGIFSVFIKRLSNEDAKLNYKYYLMHETLLTRLDILTYSLIVLSIYSYVAVPSSTLTGVNNIIPPTLASYVYIFNFTIFGVSYLLYSLIVAIIYMCKGAIYDIKKTMPIVPDSNLGVTPVKLDEVMKFSINGQELKPEQISGVQ